MMSVKGLKLASINTESSGQTKDLGALSDFRSFYRKHNQVVRAVIFRLGVENDLEDLVQSVFFKAWQNIGKFNHKSTLKTWLVRIAYNTTYDYFRKNKNALNLQGDVEEVASPEESLSEVQANRDILMRAMNKLSLDHRSVLILHIMEEFSIKEVSEVLEIPEGTVKSKLSRAREALKKEMEILGVGQ